MSAMFRTASALLLCGLVACGGVNDADDDAGAPDGQAGPDARPPDAAIPDATPPDAAPPDARIIEYNCDDLPSGPFSLRDMGGNITASEDLAFDADGNLVGSNDSTIFKSQSAGTRTPFASMSFRAALRYTAAGDLMVNDNNTNRVVRIEPDGTKHTVLSGIAYPNGMEIGIDGYVYVTEHDARRVRRIHPITGEFTLISDDEIESPNGITFNEDYTALYIGGFSGVGTIYKLPIDAEGNPGTLQEWAKDVGTGYLDGLAVDACGNVYVCDYGASRIYRISKDGATRETIIDESGPFTYMPNMQWGSGLGGWEEDRLYIPDGWSHGVFEVEIGVPGKPRVYP